MSARICICATQVPFSRGGAELLVESLRDQLLARDFEVEVVSVPFAWQPRRQILKSALAWRLLDLTEVAGRRIDLVIGTRFPSYMVQHPNKVVWLIHQFRQVYELMGTRYSDFADLPEDQEVVSMIRTMDRRCLSEARRLCTISQNTADRLQRFLGLEGEVLEEGFLFSVQDIAARLDEHVLYLALELIGLLVVVAEPDAEAGYAVAGAEELLRVFERYEQVVIEPEAFGLELA